MPGQTLRSRAHHGQFMPAAPEQSRTWGSQAPRTSMQKASAGRHCLMSRGTRVIPESLQVRNRAQERREFTQ